MHSCLVPLLVVAGAVPSGNAVHERARQEVEQQLKQLADLPDPRLEVRVLPLSRKGYVLEEASLEIDDRPVALPSPVELTDPRVVFSGPVAPGRHEITAHFVYVLDEGLLSIYTGYKYRLARSATLELSRGLSMAVDFGVRYVETAQDFKRRLTMFAENRSQMLARLDDGSMPPPRAPARPADSEPEPSSPVDLAAWPEATPGAQPAARPAEQLAAAAEPERGKRKTLDKLKAKLRRGDDGAPLPEPKAPPVVAAEAHPSEARVELPAPPAAPPPAAGPPPAATMPVVAEVPVEDPGSSRMPWVLGGVGVAVLVGVYLLWRRSKAVPS